MMLLVLSVISLYQCALIDSTPTTAFCSSSTPDKVGDSTNPISYFYNPFKAFTSSSYCNGYPFIGYKLLTVTGAPPPPNPIPNIQVYVPACWKFRPTLIDVENCMSSNPSAFQTGWGVGWGSTVNYTFWQVAGAPSFSSQLSHAILKSLGTSSQYAIGRSFDIVHYRNGDPAKTTANFCTHGSFFTSGNPADWNRMHSFAVCVGQHRGYLAYVCDATNAGGNRTYRCLTDTEAAALTASPTTSGYGLTVPANIYFAYDMAENGVTKTQYCTLVPFPYSLSCSNTATSSFAYRLGFSVKSSTQPVTVELSNEVLAKFDSIICSAGVPSCTGSFTFEKTQSESSSWEAGVGIEGEIGPVTLTFSISCSKSTQTDQTSSWTIGFSSSNDTQPLAVTFSKNKVTYRTTTIYQLEPFGFITSGSSEEIDLSFIDLEGVDLTVTKVVDVTLIGYTANKTLGKK